MSQHKAFLYGLPLGLILFILLYLLSTQQQEMMPFYFFPTAPSTISISNEINEYSDISGNFSQEQHNEVNEKAFDEEQLNDINARIWTEVLREKPQNRSNLDCQLIVSGANASFIKLLALNRFTYDDPKNLSMDCASIKARNHFLQFPLSKEQAQFPVAYARNVYKDYRFIEAELATNYHPQNWYCFAVDKKADALFQQRMAELAECFPNVIIPEKKYSIDSAGHQQADSFMACFEELAKPERKWEYVFTLQNHDVQMKTNEELVQIFKWLGGANDIQYEFLHAWPQEIIKELSKKYDWSFQGLELFRNDSKNKGANGKPLVLQLSKGQVQSSLARPFVNFLVNELSLTKVIAHLDSWGYGADELFFQTLGASDDLEAPGSFTHKCIEQKINVPHITRFTVWDYGGGRWENVGKCHSGIYRHSICMLGIEDLAPTMSDSKHLFANKMMPSSDFGAILCWHEEMRRRTLLEPGGHRLDAEFYQNWPQTRFIRQWQNGTSKIQLKEKFECNFKIPADPPDPVNF